MKLTPSLQAKLDKPIKAFEVSFRSYVVDKLLAAYPNEVDLKSALQTKAQTAKQSGFILSGKIASEEKLLNPGRWPTFWNNINFIQSCYLSKKQTEDHDVIFLSDVILMTYIFRDIYADLISSFDTPEEYLSDAETYHSVRNAISHPASYSITKTQAKECINFMELCISIIDSSYFWFLSADEISRDITDFIAALGMNAPEVDNLDLVPFPTNRIVCREPELERLFSSVCGWDGKRKLRNRKHFICVSGYGGIGKTSLVTEFISQLLEKMNDETYLGLRPSFILFYSAKKQEMVYDQSTGHLFVKAMHSQFSTCEELTTCLLHDLGIEEFDDAWSREGILVIDNLETISLQERKLISDFISAILPPSVHVITTSRIPEQADELMQLRGFQKEAGIHFIDEYISQNGIPLILQDNQKLELVKYSYGNSLVLVLALKRLEIRRTSFTTIIGEMQRLPNNNNGTSISDFMFQNTIEEILHNYPLQRSIIKSVLICLSLRQEPLTVEVLASAHQASVTVEDIEEVLNLLARYLVVEKIEDTYIINEFANHFILVSLSPSPDERREWESKLLTAINDINSNRMAVADFKAKYPNLSAVLQEWNGVGEDECLPICHAFSLYERKDYIRSGNRAYEIDQMNQAFNRIERRFRPHPYVLYQRARILKELRQEKVTGDEYNDQIKSYYERCIMMIDQPAFQSIKNTKTYPSILWIFSMFLYSINCFDEASRYAYTAVQSYELLKINSCDMYDAKAVYGLAESKLFPYEYNIIHLNNARMVYSELSAISISAKNVKEHLSQLKQELNKYTRIKT